MSIQHIMVVDDNEGDQYLTRETIERFDDSIQVTVAYDGVDALEKLNAMDVQPDVILLDINMPRLDGFGFLEKYKETNPDTTVVAMLTSSQQDTDKDKCLSYGCVKAYLYKPVDQEDLSRLSALRADAA